MTTFPFFGGNPGSILYLPATTYYATTTLGNNIGIGVTTEIAVSTPIRTAGTFSNYTRKCNANTISANSTDTFRVGGVNGAETVTFPSNTAGNVTDTTNTDTISSGNQVTDQFVTGGTGTNLTSNGTQSAFTPSSGNFIVYSTGNSINHNANSVSAFNPINGTVLANNAVEVNAQTIFRCTGTLERLFVITQTNTRITNTTITSRVSAGAGSQTITVAGGATGTAEDTTNTDAISSGNLPAISVAKSTGGGTFTSGTGVAFVPSSSQFPASWQNANVSGNSTLATVTTSYAPLAGGNSIASGGDLVTNSRFVTGQTYIQSDLFVYVNANPGTTSNSTTVSRRNGAVSNLTVVQAFSVVGLTEDTTNNNIAYASDQLNNRVINNTDATVGYNSVGELYTFANPIATLLLQNAYQKEPIGGHS